MKNIVWLVSYPKSGNTWFRIFLTNLLKVKVNSADINSLNWIPVSCDRTLIDNEIGINSSDLTHQEVDALLPDVYRSFAKKQQLRFLKVHEAWRKNANDVVLFPPEITAGVIYLVRNPLDIVISYAHHENISIDESIQIINNEKFSLANYSNSLYTQLPQNISSWSKHVESWLHTDHQLPVNCIRYEDMVANPIDTFHRTIKNIGLQHTITEVKSALKKSDFRQLQQQESKQGFVEQGDGGNAFFRKGSIGDWRNILDTKQVEIIVQHHRKMMSELGYLTSKGNPIF